MVSRDTIDLDTNDLAFCQHKNNDNLPSGDIFMQKIIEEHLAWEIKNDRERNANAQKKQD